MGGFAVACHGLPGSDPGWALPDFGAKDLSAGAPREAPCSRSHVRRSTGSAGGRRGPCLVGSVSIRSCRLARCGMTLPSACCHGGEPAQDQGLLGARGFTRGPGHCQADRLAPHRSGGRPGHPRLAVWLARVRTEAPCCRPCLRRRAMPGVGAAAEAGRDRARRAVTGALGDSPISPSQALAPSALAGRPGLKSRGSTRSPAGRARGGGGRRWQQWSVGPCGRG